MKNKLAVLFLCALVTIVACKKDEPDPPANSDNSDKIPVLTTLPVNSIMQTSASCGGEVTSDGGYTVTTRGVCWSTNQTPTVADNKTTDGAGAGTFESDLTGLSENTTYYIRAYATNTYGTGYGSTFSFTTLDILTDVDGNDYSIVKIGNQIWMAENLKTTRYNDGTSIPLVTDSASWSNLITPAYCWYDNNEVYYGNTYGALYNFYTVSTENLCPTGWHVPTKAEWEELVLFAGGANVAGGVLKETGYSHWDMPNTGATNELSFTALPGGMAGHSGGFYRVGTSSFFWTSTPVNSTKAFEISCEYNLQTTYITSNGEYDNYGFSVRCLKDQ